MNVQDYRSDQELVHRLLGLPPKIARHHDVHTLPELVLHELGHQGCVGFDKAVYLVDNPDFDCVKGVAGFCKDECKYHDADVWQDTKKFSEQMLQAGFCNHARAMTDRSVLKSLGHPAEHIHEGHLDNETTQLIGKQLGMANPVCVAWPMRHGNHGLLVLDATGCKYPDCHDLMVHCGSLLSLC